MTQSFRPRKDDAATRRRGDAATRKRNPHQRRGMLLLVVLIIISVLALIAASFSYRMNAERTGVEALGDLQQARLAAESGLARVLLLLRDDRTNMDRWYSNPESFRRVPVWMPSDKKEGLGGTESAISKEVVENQPAWRFSVVAYDQLNEDRVVMRYGLNDEAGKLNINFASRGELLRLVKTLDLRDTPPEALVDCLIDWRDKDSNLTTPAGAETPWYMMLSPSYRAKNRPFESIDELLMVKNWNGRFLFGEDHNRNGYLDENEDDGEDGAFPPDNGDGQLNRGLSRLITVYSWDWNFANDNKPRSDINAMNWKDSEKLPEQLRDELGQEVIDFLAQAKERGFKFRSVGELWGLEVYEDGSSNYDDAWNKYRDQVKKENAIPKPEDNKDGADTDQDPNQDAQDAKDKNGDKDPKDSGDSQNGNSDNGSNQDSGGGINAGDNNNTNDNNPNDNPDQNQNDVAGKKKQKNQQSVRTDGNANTGTGGGRSRGRSGNSTGGSNDQTGGNRDDGRTGNGNGGRGSNRDSDRENNQSGRNGGAGRDGDNNGSQDQDGNGRGRGRDRNNGSGGTGEGDGQGNTGENGNGENKDGENKDGENGQSGENGGNDEAKKGTPIVSPVTPEQMNIAMDRLTTNASAVQVGQINVNTAPAEVLQCLIGLTEEEAKAIVERRRSMAGPDKTTPAWLVANGALPPEKFAVLSNKLTARSIQFSADIVGFADHVGTFRRIQAIIEMRGHMAQVRYYRDISSLGIGFPVKDDERSEGLAFGNE